MKTLILPLTGFGLLTVLAPLSPAMAAPHAISAMIRDYDTNHDGKVTRDEFDAERRVRFDRTDANHDGVLSDAEYVAEFEIRLKADVAKIADPEKAKEEYDREMRQAYVRYGVLDANHDGAMTWDEYQASGHAMFDRQDRNHDKVIDETDRRILEQEEKDHKGDDFISP
ncbi:EF-hand domain-containing protein [Asticcacaulis sp. 201]|uniref:EF-hand domain-containing protein n=1 Tax=Asticcacaulis sp. 201 TaxID=3028787 RepID=UPI002915F04E|nr:EF-hand domain-containing protein [Asticcacaulis sp. 201]MDV6330251.1 EF-hand domain-containing protein [Asticcacaulis sp. 201]